MPSGRLTIKELPPDDRPREKLKALGAPNLTDAELLAIILRVGTRGETVIDLAHRLLHDYHGLTGLSKARFDELCQEHGLGAAKAAQLKAALELGRRYLIARPEERRQIRSPQDIVDLFMLEMGQLETEQLRVVLLNTKNQVVNTATVSSGSLNSSIARIGELFKEAVRQNCAAIAIVHNHPSGDPSPSADDVRVTEQAVQAGKLLDIEVVDHVIIGDHRHVSMREKKLGFQ